MSSTVKVPVTKPYLPSRDRLNQYIDGIYERKWLTNNGKLVQDLTRRLSDHLEVENLLLVSNGTLALQVAYRALGLLDPQDTSTKIEAITSPFTFIATASSLKWEGISPVFADIDPETWCLDPKNIESKISDNTRAIVPVHVFGNACDVEEIDHISKKYGLKVIYDASHAFDVRYKSASLLSWGDASTLSFHATKLFHTGEGGAVIFKNKEDLARAQKIINFGITGPEKIESLGINAKMNELQAALGLSILDEFSEIIDSRRKISEAYRNELDSIIVRQKISTDLSYNYAYFPVLLQSEEEVISVLRDLSQQGVLARRYFYPSLDLVPYLGYIGDKMAESVSISKRILCLPIYSELGISDVLSICEVIKNSLADHRKKSY